MASVDLMQIALNKVREIVIRQKERGSGGRNRFDDGWSEVGKDRLIPTTKLDNPRVFYDLPLRLEGVEEMEVMNYKPKIVDQRRRKVDEQVRQLTQIGTKVHAKNLGVNRNEGEDMTEERIRQLKLKVNSQLSSSKPSHSQSQSQSHSHPPERKISFVEDNIEHNIEHNTDHIIDHNQSANSSILAFKKKFLDLQNKVMKAQKSKQIKQQQVKAIDNHQQLHLTKRIRFKPVKVKSQVKIGHVNYEEEVAKANRTMSNLPVDKLDHLKELEKRRLIREKQNEMIRKERHYDVDEVKNFMKRKRSEAKKGIESDARSIHQVSSKPYNPQEIRHFMKRQQDKRKKMNEQQGEESKQKKKSYDPNVIREYIKMKRKKSPGKPLVDPIYDIKSSKSCRKKLTYNLLKEKQDGREVKSPQKLNPNRNTQKNQPKLIEDGQSSNTQTNAHFKRSSKFTSELANLQSVKLQQHDLHSNVPSKRKESSSSHSSTIKSQQEVNSSSSPNKSPTKTHRRTQPILNTEQLKEMLTQIINESESMQQKSDGKEQVHEFKNLPQSSKSKNPTSISTSKSVGVEKMISKIRSTQAKPLVIKVPSIPASHNLLNGSLTTKSQSKTEKNNLSFNSSISSLTNSVGTNEALSPLTVSPNSSLASKSLANINDIDDDLYQDDDGLADGSALANGQVNASEKIERSMKDLIERAIGDVSWDELYERVFKTKLNFNQDDQKTKNIKLEKKEPVKASKTDKISVTLSVTDTVLPKSPPLSRSPNVSPKSPKAMEVFPHIKIANANKSPSASELLSPHQVSTPHLPLKPKFIDQRIAIPVTTPSGPIINPAFTSPSPSNSNNKSLLNQQLNLSLKDIIIQDDDLKAQAQASASPSSSTSTPSTTKSNKMTNGDGPSINLDDLELYEEDFENEKSVEELQESYSSSFESASASNGSASINGSLSLSLPKEEMSIKERLSKIRKDHNLNHTPNGSIVSSVSSISGISIASLNSKPTSPKLSQQDLFKLTPDFDDMMIDKDEFNVLAEDDIDNDATDNVSSIRSEEVMLDDENSKEKSLSSNSKKLPEMVSDIDLDAIVRRETLRIFEVRRSKQMIRQLEPIYTSETPYKLMLCELAREVALDQFAFEDDPPLTLKLPLKLQKQRWPSSGEEFARIMCDKIGKMITKPIVMKDIRKDGLMGFCRKNKKRDLVDKVLFDEMCLEDARWAYFEPEIKFIQEKEKERVHDRGNDGMLVNVTHNASPSSPLI